MTDRWLASQFAFWVPAWVYVTMTTILLCAERASAKDSMPRWKSPSWWMLLFCAFTAIVLGFRAIPRGGNSLVQPASSTYNIVHWNMSSPDLLSFEGTLADFPACKSADIILLGVTVPQQQLQHMVAGLGNDWTIRRMGVFAIATRFEIRESVLHALGLQAGYARSGEPVFQNFYNEHLADRLGISRREFNRPDPGYVLETRIQTPERDLVIRLIDLPSNPFRSRMEIATTAAQAINTLARSGAISQSADILIGDCNIPAGSASLQRLSEGMAAAESVSKSGDSFPTWPRALPLLRIDHAWVRNGLDVLRYQTFDGGISDHRGQSLTVVFPLANPSRRR